MQITELGSAFYIVILHIYLIPLQTHTYILKRREETRESEAKILK